MNAVEAEWVDYLSEMRQLSESDFCAVAIYNASVRQTRWIAASGNMNEKYRYMVNRPGQGLTGDVIRIGRPVQKVSMKEEQQTTNDSIMLAEHLVVAAAAPIRTEDNEVEGILLIGRRTKSIYSPKELALLENAAKCLWRKHETA